MKHAAFALCALVVGTAACAPSKDIETPADPPGIDQDGGSSESTESDDSEASGEIEAEVESE
jgi:hypothetical protein